jgi:tetratricopeptide (TPR) repeat protein
MTDAEDRARYNAQRKMAERQKSGLSPESAPQPPNPNPSGQPPGQPTNCPVCGEAGLASGIQCETLFGNRQEFMRCSNCRLLFDPNPQEFRYENGFYADNPLLDMKLYVERAASVQLFSHFIVQAERALNMVRRGRRTEAGKGLLWEVGCGPGLLLDLAQYHGWKTLGVEPAPEAAKWGKDILGVPIITTSLRKDPPLTDADVVVASEVVEHLESPLEFARALSDSLKPDGIALLTTPNAESKVLPEKGSSWVHLGLGYHLVLYSAVAIERLLRNAGFQTVEVGTFEGPYLDERLIIIASKSWVPSSLLKEVLHNKLETDQEALDLCGRYLWDVVRRFDGDKNIYWQGALHRLLEHLNGRGEFHRALEVGDRLELFMQSQGWTQKYVLEVLDEASRSNDRHKFYSQVPTFIGNFHFLRGLAFLHSGREPEALESFRRAYAIAERLEKLPYKAYEELTGMLPSLHALFHIGYSLLKLGQHEEAKAAFSRFLALSDSMPAESLTQAALNLSTALEDQGRFEEATAPLDRLLGLAKEKKLSQTVIDQAFRRTLEVQLRQRSRQLDAAQQQLEERSHKLEVVQQQLKRTSQELKEARDQLAQVQTNVAELTQVIQQQDVRRRALEAQLQYLRYRIVDRLNILLHRVPGLHKLAKGLFARVLEWRRRRRFAAPEKPKPSEVLAPPPAPRPAYHPVRPISRQTAELAACTIVAKNYLSHARVLAKSFRQHNPGCPFFVLIVDRVDGYFDPELEDFMTLEIESLEIPNRERILFAYNVLEASTAVKPYLLEHLFHQHDLQKLIYFDPDILILDSLGQLSTLLDQNSIVLTPHLTAPINDTYHPDEFQILQSGAYNLGFVALRNSPVARRMLAWWQEHLRDHCLQAPEQGMFVDQKWMDLVPGLFGETYVLRDPGYNVAYWNLHERRVEIRDSRFMVNGEPGYFFHFSGIELENIETVSRHQNRFRLSALGDARFLFEHYRELIKASGWGETKAWPYAFDYFDNGVRIPEIARRLYWNIRDRADEFGDPFAAGSPSSFFRWLNSGIDAAADPSRIITRFWYEVYRRRIDVRAAYPDALGVHRDGFLAWVRERGVNELKVDQAFLARESDQEAQSLPAQELRQAINDALPFGVNVLGYIHSEKGVGEAVRAEIRNLQAAEIPFVVNDFSDVYGSSNMEGKEFRTSSENPYEINLIHVNADQLPVVFTQKRGYFSKRYNIGFWNWELSTFPAEWHDRFRYLNEVWAPSNFVKDAVSAVAPIPVSCVPISINPNLHIEPGTTRSQFGLGPDSYVFLFMFDFYSYMERKNPIGLIRAFKQAFGSHDDAILFIKTSHADFAPDAFELLQKECQRSRVILYDGIMSRERINSLICLSDCYASLHRSEGFGLTLAEAMWFGKPVIATSYSGNVDFMRETNSFLVKYRLVEIQKDHGPYKKGCVWAEPDLEHSMELMRLAYENRGNAAAVGQRGQADVWKQLHPTAVGALIRQRLDEVFASAPAARIPS